MGMEFIGSRRDFMLNYHAWRSVQQSAISNGWVPAGAIFDEWDPYTCAKFSPLPVGNCIRENDYLNNDGQLVDTSDASAIGIALRAALFFLAKEEKSSLCYDTDSNTLEMVNFTLDYTKKELSEILSQRRWSLLMTDFAAFCEEGAFRIT